MSDAVGSELKPDRSHADHVGERGAIQSKALIIREPKEVGEGAMRNDVEHVVVAPARGICHRFIRGEHQIVEVDRAIGPPIVLPVFDHKDQILHARDIHIAEGIQQELVATPGRVIRNVKDAIADNSIGVLEFDLDAMLEISVAIATSPEAECDDIDVFDAGGVASAVPKCAVKVGEIQRMLGKSFLAQQGIPYTAKARPNGIVQPQGGAMRASEHLCVKSPVDGGRAVGKRTAVAGEAVEDALVVVIRQNQLRGFSRERKSNQQKDRGNCSSAQH
jgi:hypothetical protein